MSQKNANIWWGPPRKFTPVFEERRITWLELFYDLVYVIVISKVTHHLAQHPDWQGLENYLFMFCIVFWGWLNGSLYYDLHGTPGIRTRFMTLWQMVAVAALAVTLESPPELMAYRGTIAIAVLQIFITYLWWSVGIYDKHHRKLNLPYTVCYLMAFACLLSILFVPVEFHRGLFWVTLLLNYLPPFLGVWRLRKQHDDFSLSSSMTERMGLITIIVFGEAILGVINGASGLASMQGNSWINFGLGILIVFLLWWIFFALIADRECKKGFLRGQVMLISFIPVLASLGMTGASFPAVMMGATGADTNYLFLERLLFGVGISVFLWSITLISVFLEYPEEYNSAKRLLQPMLILTGIVMVLLTWWMRLFPLTGYLFIIMVILIAIVFVITRKWFVLQLKQLTE